MPDAEVKALSFETKDGKFIISLDPNKDGQPVAQFSVDIAEVPDEVLSVVLKK